LPTCTERRRLLALRKSFCCTSFRLSITFSTPLRVRSLSSRLLSGADTTIPFLSKRLPGLFRQPPPFPHRVGVFFGLEDHSQTPFSRKFSITTRFDLLRALVFHQTSPVPRLPFHSLPAPLVNSRRNKSLFFFIYLINSFPLFFFVGTQYRGFL